MKPGVYCLAPKRGRHHHKWRGSGGCMGFLRFTLGNASCISKKILRIICAQCATNKICLGKSMASNHLGSNH